MGAVFVIAASLLILDKMLKLFDFVATEGGPVSVVFRMLANLLPEYAGLAIPLGLLMGILLAFRKLATSSELDVMRAVGLSYSRLLRVPYAITLVLAAVNLVVVGYLQPMTRYWYEQLQFELRSGALGASIKVGEFTTLQDKMALRIEQRREEGREAVGQSLRQPLQHAHGQPYREVHDVIDERLAFLLRHAANIATTAYSPTRVSRPTCTRMRSAIRWGFAPFAGTIHTE